MKGARGHSVQMRWQDLDGLGHVNHNVVLTYLEEGRDAFLAAHGIRRENYVVGSCSVRFIAEIDPANETLTAECALHRIGRSSLTTTERVLSRSGDVLVEAEFGLVLWDPKLRRSRPIGELERGALEGSLAAVSG